MRVAITIFQLPADFRFTLVYLEVTNIKISEIKKCIAVQMNESCWVNHDQE